MVVAAAAATCAAADPTVTPVRAWGPPQRVAVEGVAQFSSVRLAVGPDGSGLLAWASRRPEFAIRAVNIAPDGTIGRPQRLSRRGDRASAPQVGIARGGEAVVAWRSGRAPNRTVTATVRQAGATSFGPRVRISPAGVHSNLTALGMGPDGRAVAAWLRKTDAGWRVEVAERTAGGSFGAPRTLSKPRSWRPSVAVGGDGSRIVVWRRRVGGGRVVVEASLPRPDQPLAETTLLSRSSYVSGPRVAVDAEGAAVVGWIDRGAAGRLQAVTRSSSLAAFGPATTLARSSSPGGGFGEIELAMAAGRAYATWTDYEAEPPIVRVARTDADGAWSPGEAVSDPSSTASHPEVRAVRGRAVVSWHDIAQSGVRRGHVAATTAHGAGQWSQPETISDPDLIVPFATSPRLAIAPDGTALVAYVDYGFEEDSGRGQLSIVRLPPS